MREEPRLGRESGEGACLAPSCLAPSCLAPSCLRAVAARAAPLAGLAANIAGSVSMIFSLVLPAALVLLGGVVDFVAITQSNAQLQAAVDSAALSVAREITLASVTQQRAQDLASSYVLANLGAEQAIKVTATLIENQTGIQVQASQPSRAPLGILPPFLGVETFSALAIARIPANATQSRLCLLSLGDRVNGGIFLHNGSTVVAPECVLNSNSTIKNAAIVQAASKVKANLLCARGGVQNYAGMLETLVLSDCPEIRDPLAAKPEPLILPCINNKLKVKSQTTTLEPGVYCKGVTISGTSKVTLKPGQYVFQDGPLEVQDKAELVGAGVTLMFSGKNAFFRFLDSSLIQLSAPVSGSTAGMLLWELKSVVLGANSWINGGCGTGSPPLDVLGVVSIDVGPNGCTQAPAPGTVPPKKLNEHQINSTRAKELTGTIYLPRGLLLIDSKTPVADQSPFTVIVVNKLDLYDGPVLTLNSNYSGSPVPVPAGLGPIGAKQVTLTR